MKTDSKALTDTGHSRSWQRFSFVHIHDWHVVSAYTSCAYPHGTIDIDNTAPLRSETNVLQQCLTCKEHKEVTFKGLWTLDELRSAEQIEQLERMMK